MQPTASPHTDFILRALSELPEPLGSLVRSFPGRAAASEDTHWIDAWFRDQATAFTAGKTPSPIKLTAREPSADESAVLKKTPVSVRVRLLSLLPHYFRGFRLLQTPAVLEADLILIEGPNSSGKTSLSEALEWLFTGTLSRRSSGHPRELANCIANEFTPQDEQTWVECVLSIDSKPTTIRRVLIHDYSEKASGTAQSDVYRDGVRLSEVETRQLFEDLFAGVSPILMQHTLRRFVHDTPEDRRQYFERLLQIDELTALIEKAVVGDSRLKDFLPPTGALSYAKWDQLCSMTGLHSRSVTSDLESSALTVSKQKLQAALMTIARKEFAGVATSAASFVDAQSKIEAAQVAERENRFPFLASLRPRADTSTLHHVHQALAPAKEALRSALDAVRLAKRTAQTISQADLAVSRALEALIEAGLVEPDAHGPITCPLCDYKPAATLTPQRVRDVQSRLPLAAAIENAKARYVSAANLLEQEIQAARESLVNAAPRLTSAAKFEAQLKGANPQLILDARGVHSKAVAFAAKVGALDVFLASSLAGLRDRQRQNDDNIHKLLDDLFKALPTCGDLGSEYSTDFLELENLAKILASDSANYQCERIGSRSLEISTASCTQSDGNTENGRHKSCLRR